MDDSDNVDTLTNIKTLEEAKKEIARLLEFQKRAYYFLGVFCNYDIREPLLSANGLAKLLENKESVQQHPIFLKTVLANHERIDRISKAVRHAATVEQGGKKRIDFLKTGYPVEELYVNSILDKSIQEIKEVVEHQNYQRNIDSKDEPLQVNVILAKDLPVAQCNSSMLADVLSDLVWFITDAQIPKTEINLLTDFDNQWVKIIFRCFTLEPHRYVFVLDEFNKFNDKSSFVDFNPMSLFLYNSYNTLKMYDGLLSYSVQDNTEKRTPSIIEIIIWLKR